MKNVKQVLQDLKRQGFVLETGNGSIIKIYPPNPNQKFYSFHSGEKGLHPLRRFAKKEWGIKL